MIQTRIAANHERKRGIPSPKLKNGRTTRGHRLQPSRGRFRCLCNTSRGRPSGAPGPPGKGTSAVYAALPPHNNPPCLPWDELTSVSLGCPAQGSAEHSAPRWPGGGAPREAEGSTQFPEPACLPYTPEVLASTKGKRFSQLLGSAKCLMKTPRGTESTGPSHSRRHRT